MDTFVWDQNFVTGLPEVDEQHHALVDLFNELSRSLFLSDASREVVLNDTFDRLVAYTQYHFRDEEALMPRAWMSAMWPRTAACTTSLWRRSTACGASAPTWPIRQKPLWVF